MAEPYELAMFPLEYPVLPGAVIPLHLFEPRYQALAKDLQAQPEPEFGIVGITRGREVGGDAARASLGVVARVLELDALDDGRWSLVAGATRRIRIDEWRQPAPYPKATVTDWPDEFEPDLADSVPPLRDAVATLLEVARRRRPELDVHMPDLEGTEPDRAIWHLIDFAGLGPLDRLDLLAHGAASQRAAAATAMIIEQAAMLDALDDT